MVAHPKIQGDAVPRGLSRDTIQNESTEAQTGSELNPVMQGECIKCSQSGFSFTNENTKT